MTPDLTGDPPTRREALVTAVRLLRNAESVTDLILMERLMELADRWLEIAELLGDD